MLRQKKVLADSPHILLVESDEFLADIYEKNLAMEGFRVTKVMTAERALKILQTKDIHLVLASVILPKLNGFELLTLIKNDSDLSSLPVIMLSKLGTAEDVQKSKQLGSAGFIIKTHFQPSEIVDKIKKVLFHI
jgi:DNA-binding response OmpR family regulator